ncbi:unnamed protein product [Rotaria sp. Silwood2]|nr:unnamed protein product [Rotaria sp. Silwood2]CAF4546338.1 unnamed protein product [Rotaria sp. Silwood2]
MSRKGRYTAETHVVLWLNENIDPTNDDYQNTIARLHDVVNEVEPCRTVEECIQHLHESNQQTAFVISSESLGQHLVPVIHDIPELDAIYIFCNNKPRDEEWTENWRKIKGVNTSIEQICDALQRRSR